MTWLKSIDLWFVGCPTLRIAVPGFRALVLGADESRWAACTIVRRH